MVETKARLSRLDGAETKADRRQGQRRAKNRKNILSQRMPVGDPGERTQHSLHLLSPAKAMQPRDSPPQENWPHAPWPSEVGSCAHSKTARMSGVSPVVKKGSLATDPLQFLPWYLSAATLGPARQALLPWLGPWHTRLPDPLPYGWGNPWENGAGVD